MSSKKIIIWILLAILAQAIKKIYSTLPLQESIINFYLIPITLSIFYLLILFIILELGLFALSRYLQNARYQHLNRETINRRTGVFKKIFYPLFTGLEIFFIFTWILFQVTVRFDFTPGQITSLSPAAKSLLTNIKKEITIRAYYNEDDPIGKSVKSYLVSLEEANPFIKHNFFDKKNFPAKAQKDRIPSNGYIVFDNNRGRREQMLIRNTEELYSMEKTGVKILLELTAPAKTIYYEVGREGDLWKPGKKNMVSKRAKYQRYSTLHRMLSKRNYRLIPLDLKSDKKCRALFPIKNEPALIIGGYTGTAPSPECRRFIANFLNNKRKLFLMTNGKSNYWNKNFIAGFSESEEIFNSRSSPKGGIIRKINSPQNQLLIIPDYPGTELTKNLRPLQKQSRTSIWPSAMPLFFQKSKFGLDLESFVLSASDTWYDQNGNNFREKPEKKGPFALGVFGKNPKALKKKDILSKKNKIIGQNQSISKTGGLYLLDRFIVIGSDSVAGDNWISNPGNRLLALSMVDWLFEDKRVGLLKSKKVADSALPLKRDSKLNSFLFLVIFYPILIIVSFQAFQRYLSRKILKNPIP